MITVASAFSACGPSDAEPGGSSGATPDAAPTDAPPADALLDAGPRPPRDAPCPVVPIDAGAPIIRDELVSGDRPLAVGGEVVPGTYFLSRSEIYIGDGGTTVPDAAPREPGPRDTTITRTVTITSDFLRSSEAVGNADGGPIGAREERTLAYTPVGLVLVITALCPERADSFQIEYSVIGSELHLFPSATQREVLARQP